MKKIIFLFCVIFLVSCGQKKTEETASVTENSVISTEEANTKKLLPEEQKALDDFMKNYEEDLRSRGTFDEETIQKALKIIREEKTAEILAS